MALVVIIVIDHNGFQSPTELLNIFLPVSIAGGNMHDNFSQAVKPTGIFAHLHDPASHGLCTGKLGGQRPVNA